MVNFSNFNKYDNANILTVTNVYENDLLLKKSIGYVKNGIISMVKSIEWRWTKLQCE